MNIFQEPFKNTLNSIFSHSTARAFLVFSAILVIFSVIYGKEYVLLSFYTFFYALIAHKIVVIRKFDEWDKCLVGSVIGAGLFFLLDLLLFIGWIIGVIVLLSGIPSTDLVNLLSSSNRDSLIRFLYFVLIFAGIVFAVWIIQAVIRKITQKN